MEMADKPNIANGVKIGSPVYILREEAQKDLAGVMRRLSEIGYEGIELTGLFGRTAQEVRGYADALGFPVMGDHVPLERIEAEPDAVFAEREALGVEYLTIGVGRALLQGGDAQGDAQGDAHERQAIERIGACARKVKAAGYVPLYHNHNYDAFFLEALADACSDIALEPDVGWMLFAGQDPARILAKYSTRCPVIHLKDIYVEDAAKLGPDVSLGALVDRDPALGGFAFRPTGYGVANIPALWPLCAACRPAWLVMDHDCAYARDPYDDMRLGYAYLRDLLRVHPFA